MADSLRSNYRLTLSLDLLPARTAGPLGSFDAADPSVTADWLDAHKDEYRVHRIDTEAWHWEFELDTGILWDSTTIPTTTYA